MKFPRCLKLMCSNAASKIFLLEIACLLGWPIAALAHCAQPHPPVCAEFFHSDAVFVGTVISSKYRSQGEELPAWLYTLKVTRVFRGERQLTSRVFTEQ